MVQAFEVNFDGFSTEFGKSLHYLHCLCFTFSSTSAKQSSPLLLSENELLMGMSESERRGPTNFFDVLLRFYTICRSAQNPFFVSEFVKQIVCLCVYAFTMTLKMFIFTFRKRDLSMVFWCIVMKWVFHNNFTIFSPFTHFCVFIFWYLKTRIDGQWWSSYCFQ